MFLSPVGKSYESVAHPLNLPTSLLIVIIATTYGQRGVEQWGRLLVWEMIAGGVDLDVVPSRSTECCAGINMDIVVAGLDVNVDIVAGGLV